MKQDHTILAALSINLRLLISSGLCLLVLSCKPSSVSEPVQPADEPGKNSGAAQGEPRVRTSARSAPVWWDLDAYAAGGGHPAVQHGRVMLHQPEVTTGIHPEIRIETLGSEGVWIRITLWNNSGETAYVPPFHPAYYQVLCRDDTSEFPLLTMPIGDRPLLGQSELPMIDPGTFMGVLYHVPSFYKLVGDRQHLEVRVTAQASFLRERGVNDIGEVRVVSEWQEVSLPD